MSFCSKFFQLIVKAVLCTTVLCIASNSVHGATVFIGPTPYLQQYDSPYANEAFQYFLLEDFEDGLLNTAGLSANYGSIISSSIYVDSVDADDGEIDGSGQKGHSWYGSFGQSVPADITFYFDESVLGKLPTHVGMVWTDSAGNGGTPAPASVSIEVFGPLGQSLGVYGPFRLGDSSSTGQTAEDRFLGANDNNGISAIRIFQNLRQIEVDHIQYGFVASNLSSVPAMGLPGICATIFLLIGLVGIELKKKFGRK